MVILLSPHLTLFTYYRVVLVLSGAVLVLVIENTKDEHDYEHRSATPH